MTLRIGLNSGPTTAGVLRGEKARFQLFGDVSVYNITFCVVPVLIIFISCMYFLYVYFSITDSNTAARMESNGHANKIQISQSTATLIQSAGYG